MDQTSDGTNHKQPRSGYFLGCFGFSGEEFSKESKNKVAADNDHGNTNSTGTRTSSSRREKRRLFWWIKKSGCKTVPVDAATSDKPNQSTEIHKLGKKVSSKKSAPATGVNSCQTPATLPEGQMTSYENVQSINLDTGDNLDNSDMKKDTATCKKGLPCRRKKGAKKMGCNHPNSPENKSLITQTKSTATATTTLSHSISFPPPKGQKHTASTGQISQIREHKSHKRRGAAQENDSIIGLSIIMVILVVMLHWGKVYAILCTAAWFYIIPRLKVSSKSQVGTANKFKKNHIDLDSGEYKKKVVLGGFLERNHRSVTGIL